MRPLRSVPSFCLSKGHKEHPIIFLKKNNQTTESIKFFTTDKPILKIQRRISDFYVLLSWHKRNNSAKRSHELLLNIIMMRIKSLDLKSFARKIYEVCPLVRPKPEHSDSIHSNSIHAAPSGSLESPPLMDMLLVLQRKEFNVAKPNQEDLINLLYHFDR